MIGVGHDINIIQDYVVSRRISDISCTSDADSSTSCSNDKSSKKVLNTPLLFPHKLYNMLEETAKDGHEDIVSWVPVSRNDVYGAPMASADDRNDEERYSGFIIYDREKFASIIIPRYLNDNSNSSGGNTNTKTTPVGRPSSSKTIKFRSFLRLLNMYGFERVRHGMHKGAYRHEHFIRGKPDLCNLIQRLRPSDKMITSPQRRESDSQTAGSTRRGGRNREYDCSPADNFATTNSRFDQVATLMNHSPMMQQSPESTIDPIERQIQLLRQHRKQVQSLEHAPRGGTCRLEMPLMLEPVSLCEMIRSARSTKSKFGRNLDPSTVDEFIQLFRKP